MEFNATLIGEIIAFAILIAFAVKVIWPPLLNAIEERQNMIADGLSQAEKARKELADADARVAEEIKKARVEAAQIIDRANQQAVQIVDKARQDAVVEATKQKAIAAADIEAQAYKAREELRGKVASLAVAGAEKILHREIDANAHKTLIDQLVAEI
jgi:F-type H+-transporting ATPase subunit b